MYEIFLDYEWIYKEFKVVALVLWEQWKRKCNNNKWLLSSIDGIYVIYYGYYMWLCKYVWLW